MKKKIISVVGARPNFIKIAPIHKAFNKYDNDIEHIICHTGQHFDKKMSKVFFDELEIPKPNFNLGIGSGSHGEQTAKIILAFEKIILQEKPDLIIVPGDVNSTLAASITASKLNIPIAHIEAGLRSFDMKMPEEINRILTDRISNLLFVTEKSGIENLKREGVDNSKIFFAGNVMIDSLVFYSSKINKSNIIETLSLNPKEYILATFHRPSNVDNKDSLKSLLKMLNNVAKKTKVVFPIHPRTKNNITKFNLNNLVNNNIIFQEPLGYIDFLSLIKNSKLVVTDSGGIQEETTFLRIQCVTIRNTTERPITCEIGTNHLVGTDFSKAESVIDKIFNGYTKKGYIPELWDGKAAERITKIIVDYLI